LRIRSEASGFAQASNRCGSGNQRGAAGGAAAKVFEQLTELAFRAARSCQVADRDHDERHSQV
jgi:hypothetical protein